MITTWIHSLKTCTDPRLTHLFIDHIDVTQNETNTGFKVTSTLKPMLEKVVAGEIDTIISKLPSLLFYYYMTLPR